MAAASAASAPSPIPIDALRCERMRRHVTLTRVGLEMGRLRVRLKMGSAASWEAHRAIAAGHHAARRAGFPLQSLKSQTNRR